MERGITDGRRTKDNRTKGNRMNKKRLIFTALIAAILLCGVAAAIYAGDSFGKSDGKSEEDRENISLAAITGYDQDYLRLTVLSDARDEDTEIEFPPCEEVYLLTEDGTKYYAEDFDGEDTFFFRQKLREGMQLVLPYLKIRESGAKAEVTLCRDSSPTGKKLKLGDRSVILRTAEWSDYTEQFNMKMEDGSRVPVSRDAQKIRLRIETVPGSDLLLDDIFADAAEEYVNRYEYKGMELRWSDPYRFDEDGYFYVTNLLSDIDEAKIVLYDPVYLLDETIKIEVRP